MIDEDAIEQDFLKTLSQNGWDVLCGYDIAPDSPNSMRKSYEDVHLPHVLQSALQRINTHIPASVLSECTEQAMAIITKPKEITAIDNNIVFYKHIKNGIPVTYKHNDQIVSDTMAILDFENIQNNTFYAINQFTITGTKQNRRPDVICFINGLPLVVVELKKLQESIWTAYDQLETYKDEITDVFAYNIANIISNGQYARIGSLTANMERFMPWRTIENEDDKPKLEYELDVVAKGFLRPDLLLQYIRHFILFEKTKGKTIKKIAGYHQFHAVLNAVRSTITATSGNKKGGVVWHTQGSGKSISMCCYAGMIAQQSELKNPTILVVTDRNDLDGQLFETFSDASDLLTQKPIQVDSRDSLREILSTNGAGGIIFTTVQKFSMLENETSFPVLNDRHNIIVLSDEAHRSQYGLQAKMDKDGNIKYGYARCMRDALPNATFLGFTGTPISFEDKDTQAVFGEYVSIYDIEDAVNDGATKEVYYEARQARLSINQEEIEELSQQAEEVAESDDLSEKEKTKSTWSTLEKLMGTKERLQSIAQDFVMHFEKRKETLNSKSMFVAMSRQICTDLYKEIVAIRPEWDNQDPTKGKIKIIMTGSASDPADMQKHIYSKSIKKDLEKRFKDPQDDMEIAIVCDMWLTGFDVPCCSTMYIDKPMKGHTLMQAITRVNRVFEDKTGGLVVDYIGIANELKEATATYTKSKGKGRPAIPAEDALEIVEQQLHKIKELCDDFGNINFNESTLSTIVALVNHIIGLENGKKQFKDMILRANKAFSLCNTHQNAKEFEVEIAFFNAVNKTMASMRPEGELVQKKKTSTLKYILDNAVQSDDVVDIFALCDLKKPNIGLLSDDFLESVAGMSQKNIAVELLEKLIKDEIQSKERSNIIREKTYSDRLMETLNKYHNRSIETAQVIEMLLEIAQDYKQEVQDEKNLGLSEEEVAFYTALGSEKGTKEAMEETLLKNIAIEITKKIKNSATVDWQKRENVRSKLKREVRRILQKYGYPPKNQIGAVEKVLEQAEAISDIISKKK